MQMDYILYRVDMVLWVHTHRMARVQYVSDLVHAYLCMSIEFLLAFCILIMEEKLFCAHEAPSRGTLTPPPPYIDVGLNV